MNAYRLAALDIGTNSIRSIVVQSDAHGKFHVLDDEKVPVRLGEGLNRTGSLSEAARERALQALSRQMKIIECYGVGSIEAVATSAVRKAANGAEFVAAIKNKIGLEVEVISGEEEAELAMLSAQNNFTLGGVRNLIFDIGGGSLELITAQGATTEELLSLELGAVFLTDTFLQKDPVDPDELQKLRKHVRKALKNAFSREERISIQCLIGSGGTVTSIASMVMAARQERYGSCHGYEILRGDLAHLLATLLRKNNKERRSVPGLSPERADIIVAGIAVVGELMDFFGANVLKVNERGIREGLILRGLHRHQMVPEEGSPRCWRESVLEFGRRCKFDEAHALQVTRLSLAVFDALSTRFGFTTNERRLLEAAALLHDVGHFINYSSHHKHSYHLIRHADLFDLTSRERELVANIARYHRKSPPKKKHDPFVRLAMQDRLLVARLGGIVRLCDSLDRRHNSIVNEVECTLSADSAGVMLVGREDMSVELFGAKSKGALFMAAFGLLLEVQTKSAAAVKRRRPYGSLRKQSLCVDGYGELAITA